MVLATNLLPVLFDIGMTFTLRVSSLIFSSSESASENNGGERIEGIEKERYRKIHAYQYVGNYFP